jgi:uncharacterized protein YqjF (DUF2071 family)
MSIFKKIPVKYMGELHNVKLVNFSVDISEVESLVPAGIKARSFNGRAMISMVNVLLKNMRPSFVPSALCFSYRHVAFRLLVEDSDLNDGENKGIYFLRSFTDKPLIVLGGKMFTDYNLESAQIKSTENMLELRQGDRFLTYALDETVVPARNEELYKVIGSVDRAYSVLGSELRMVQIMREKWPIEPVECYHFQTNFFKTAKLEGAFRVNEVIHYQWLPPKTVRPCA